MQIIKIIITGHPVAKGRGRAVATRAGHARIVTPAKTRRWEEDARMVARAKMGQRKPLAGPVEVKIFASFVITPGWPKWKREAAENGRIYHTTRPDGDNIMKTAKDAMNGIVWIDDAQVVQATVSKHYGDKPFVEIVVREMCGVGSQISTKGEYDAAQETLI